MTKKQPSIWLRVGISALLLFALLMVGTIIALIFSTTDTDVSGANTAIVRITGVIMGDDGSGIFDDSIVSSRDVVKQLEKIKKNDDITAVILEINSPGGSAVASDEIGQKVKELRAEGKIVVTWIREVGASGAYWIASASDHIVANRMSITGSIGVISSYLEFSEFLDDWNLTYNRLVAGEKKDIGDPFRELQRAERLFLQKKLDRIHTFFIEEVATNRNMSTEAVTKYADGSFYLGVEAAEIGLVDELGGKNEAIAYIENRTGTDVETKVYGREKGLLEALFGAQPTQPVPQTAIPMLR